MTWHYVAESFNGLGFRLSCKGLKSRHGKSFHFGLKSHLNQSNIKVKFSSLQKALSNTQDTGSKSVNKFFRAQKTPGIVSTSKTPKTVKFLDTKEATKSGEKRLSASIPALSSALKKSRLDTPKIAPPKRAAAAKAKKLFTVGESNIFDESP